MTESRSKRDSVWFKEPMKTLDDTETGPALLPGAPDPGELAPMGNPAAEVCMPLASLAMPDEGEKMENPEVGDPVTWTGEGKVSRIEGDQAYVIPSSINGQPVKPSEPAGPKSDEAEMSDLQGMASQMPERY